MTIQQLQYFLELTETLNFSKVAASMHVSQPNLSHSISALEQELGVKLFLRQKGKKAELTVDGRTFYPYVKNALSALEEGISSVKATEVTRRSQLRVAYSHVYGLVISPYVSYKLRQQYPPETAPTIRFTVVQSKVDFCRMVEENDVDVAFTFSPGNAGVGMIPVEQIPLKVIISKDHPLRDKDVITFDDIADEPLICCDQEPFLHQHILNLYKAHNRQPNIRTIFPDWGPQFSNVSYNAGIAITPSIPMATDFILVKDLEDPMNSLPYNCLYRTSDMSNKLLKKYLQIVMSYSSDEAREQL